MSIIEQKKDRAMDHEIQLADAEILVVDDILANLNLLNDILRTRGYRVRPAGSGQLALRSAALKSPDLILLDVKMPGMDGYEVCRALKSDVKNADVPVIFISALDETLDKVRGFEAGGVDFITKPFHPEEVLARVETHLSLRRLHLQLEQQYVELQNESAKNLEKEREIRELNDFCRKIVENAALGVLAYNGSSGQCIMANQAAAKIVNTSVEQLLAQKLSNIPLFQQQDHLYLVNQVLETGITQDKKLHVVTSFGREAWLECRASRFLAQGEPHFLLLMHDVTEQQYFQESLKEAKEAAEAANKTKSEFLANVSHEIRTPINAVIGFGDLLSATINDPRQKSYIESIQTAGESLLRLINDILDLSKIEAGKLELNYVPTNLKDLTNGIERFFSLQASQKDIQLITVIDPELPNNLLLDETRFRQVLMNLVGNAVKFTEKGYIKLAIQALNTTETDNNTVNINVSVEDTGIGIAQHDINLIFESFRQQSGQSLAKYGGTGLGLAICKRIVEIMGGTISVKTVLGKGSTFTVNIQNVAISCNEPETVKLKPQYETMSFNQASVLVVDDDQSNREILRVVLSKMNLIVLTAVNGQEALTIAGEHLPDVIIMDLSMPEMDGIGASEYLKRNLKTQTIPIIAMSACSLSEYESSVSAKTFDGFLPKPFKTNELFYELSNHLQIANEDSKLSRSSEESLLTPLAYRSPEMTTNLSELINVIDTEFMDQWENIKKLITMKSVRKFAKDLELIGIKHTSARLSNYGRDLLFYADGYDVEKVKIMINKFPDTVNKLKLCEEKNHDAR